MNNKNYFVNLVKAVAAYAVVVLHCGDYIKGNDIYNAVNALVRFAVPFFFMVSGFYTYGKDNKNTGRKAFKIFKLMLIAYLVYTLWFMINRMPNINYILHTFESWKSWDVIRNFLAFNLPFPGIGGHLWFLGSLLYCYLITILIHKGKLHGYFYFLSPFLLLFLLSYKDVFSYLGVYLPTYFIRNFVFVGLPFFMLGNWFGKNKNKIQQMKISKLHILLIMLLGMVLTVLDRYARGQSEVYLGSVLIVIGIFIYAVKYPSYKPSSNFFISGLQYIGEKYSLFIYIVHLMVLQMLGKLDLDIINKTLPAAAIIVTTTAAVIFYSAEKYLGAGKLD